MSHHRDEAIEYLEQAQELRKDDQTERASVAALMAQTEATLAVHDILIEVRDGIEKVAKRQRQ